MCSRPLDWPPATGLRSSKRFLFADRRPPGGAAIPSLIDRLRDAVESEYEVERELGRGGMGSIFLGRDPALDRLVAFKVLRPELATAGAAERFLREARMLARISHPNVVPIYRVGESGGLYYYLMEYVAGDTLADRIADGPQAPELAVGVALAVLQALEAVHAEALIHRDIKPANILLTGDRVLLADFGIAKPQDPDSWGTALTSEGQAVGTPAYMAPEQASGEDVGPPTDIYAVGEVLYESLTGRRWKIGGKVDWSGVEDRVRKTAERALELDPRDRWKDAASFRRALENAATTAGIRIPGVESRRQTRPLALAGWVAATVAIIALGGLTALWVGGSQTGPSIAVRTCDNLSPDNTADHVAHGLAQELVTALVEVPQLRVMGRGSADVLGPEVSDSDVADELGVENIIRCSIETDRELMRITVLLVDADGFTRDSWTEDARIDQPWIQQLMQVADAVADELQLERAPGTVTWRPPNPDAWDLWSQGLAQWDQRTPEGLIAAERLFVQALHLDSAFPEAMAGLALVYATQPARGLQTPSVAFPKADSLASAVIDLGPTRVVTRTRAQALAVRGEVARTYSWRWSEASEFFLEAIAIDPSYATARLWYANHLLAMGDSGQAIAEARLAVRNERAIPNIRTGLATLLFHTGEYDSALVVLEDTPATFREKTLWEIGVLLFLDRKEEALDILEMLEERGEDLVGYEGPIAFVYAKAGETDHARRLLATVKDRQPPPVTPPFWIMAAHAQLGDEREWTSWLDSAYAYRDELLTYLNVTPILEPIRGRPKVDTIAELMGLPR